MVLRSLLLAALVVVCPAMASAQLRGQVYVSGLSSPVGFVQDPSNPGVQYVLEQGGHVRVIDRGVLLPTDFLTIQPAEISTGGERGLLGIAFPANYAASGRFYVNFTNAAGHTVVARFRRSAGNPLVADPASRFDLQWPSGNRYIEQPYANHNGGHLAFGPDGYLYIGLGDGGASNDPQGRAQNPNTLLGKMLRIDVSVSDAHPTGYQVPAGNPFVDSTPIAALHEIWSFGLRNPWRYSFDNPAHGGTGALVIGDVGQNAWEEISYEPPLAGGRNYGWCNREGAHNNTLCPTTSPAFWPLTEPVQEYSHSLGSSITGGFVYRGRALASHFFGRYFYADLTGRVWSVGLSVNQMTGEATATGVEEHTAALGGFSMLGYITSFGTDSKGELYIVNYSAGAVIKVLGLSDPGEIVADFSPYGLWTASYAGGWSQLHGVSPKSMVTADLDANGVDEIVVDFGNPYGIWIWTNNTSWVQLHALTANHMAAGDLDRNGQEEVIIDFPGYGIWIRYNNTAWFQLHPQQSSRIVVANLDGAAGADVVVDFPGQGIWVYRNNTTWGRIHPENGGQMAAGDFDGSGRDDLAVSFPAYGIYVWANDTGWNPLHPLAAPRMAAGNTDSNPQSELVIDFGPAQGIWILRNGATWIQLHAVTSERLLLGDLDRNGQDDVIVDFGSTYGLWVNFNQGGWGRAHFLSPGPLTFGHVRPPGQ